MAMILTLGFDSVSFGRFEVARQRHFPPARNFIPAHLTLFQQLPSDRIAALHADVVRTVAQQAPLSFTVDGLMPLGAGVAYTLAIPGFAALHRRLREVWAPILTAADDRPRKPHVTVQNKVPRYTAEATLAQLRASFVPWAGSADRLLLWHYRGGPWEAAGSVALGRGIAHGPPVD